jgi:hypothetical protein
MGRPLRQGSCPAGRETQRITLHEALIRDGAVGVITAANGFGGPGKTEFAVAYAHTRADCYPGGLWVLAAEGRTELLPLFGERAGDARLGIPPSAWPDETAARRGLRLLARMKALADAAAARDPMAALPASSFSTRLPSRNISRRPSVPPLTFRRSTGSALSPPPASGAIPFPSATARFSSLKSPRATKTTLRTSSGTTSRHWTPTASAATSLPPPLPPRGR